MTDSASQNTTKDQKGITPDGFLTDSWYLAAVSTELKRGSQFRRIIINQPVMLGRTKDGTPFALRDICPHRLVPLSAGRQVDTRGEVTVQCPYHGWRFGTDGVCRHMPSLVEGQKFETERIKVRRFPIHEANGAVYVYISHDHRFDGKPVMPPPTFGDLPEKPKFVGGRTFEAHMDDAIVGLMDPAHVPFVHNQWWWRPPAEGLKLKEKEFVPTDRGWAIDRHQPSSNSRLYRWVFGRNVTTEIRFQLPGFRWEVIENAKTRILTLTCLTPEAPKRTRITQLTWWRGSFWLDLAIPFAKPMARKFLDQDGDMVDLQNEGMKYQKNMLWIDDIDVQAKWYQVLKKEWEASRTQERKFKNPIKQRTLRWNS